MELILAQFGGTGIFFLLSSN